LKFGSIHATKYLGCAIEFYKDEKERQSRIASLLDQAIGELGEWRSDWNTLGLHGHALYPAIVDYSKIVSRDKV
jgi:hypothetical protein